MMTETHPKIVVIVPARNESANIAAVLADLRGAAKSCDILVVDDGSSDDTVLQAKADRHANVISLPFNLGIGGAVQTGFLYARRKGYDLAVQCDGDGQHIAGEIPKLLAPLLEDKADVVIGSRFLDPGNSYSAPLLRRCGMLVFEAVNSLLIGRRITDNTSGFRAYNRRAIQFLAEHYPDDYPEPEAVILLGRNGFRITEVPVTMRPRLEGRSSISGLRSVYYMAKVLLTVLMNGIRARIVN
ncbi:MAG: glycosyltransferase family 2 protein [Candidatus Edwardsbacteria bacterium]|nr:glycosyltransferase family 2 protein [Candidatus Edwardsbacteria bacterium]